MTNSSSSCPPYNPAPADLAFQRFQKSGNPDELGKVFDETATKLLQAATQLTPDLPTADDLVQATYLAAIVDRHEYRIEEGSVLAWLFGILVNRARLHRRQAERSIDPGRLRVAEVPEPQRELEAEELSQEVLRAIERLPRIYQPVIRLYVIYGQSPQEISLNLDRPSGTVRTQIKRGLEMLRRALPSSLIAGTVALTTPVAGLAEMRQVVLAKAASAQAVAKSSLLSSVLGANKATALLVGAGTLLAATFGVTLFLANGSRELPQTPTPTALSPAVGFADSSTEANQSVLPNFGHSNNQAQVSVSFVIPPPMATPCPLTSNDPRRIQNMTSFTSTSFTSPQPQAVPVPMRTLSTLVLSTSLLFPVLLPSQSPIFIFKGQISAEHLGSCVSSASDVNLDGYPDLLVSATNWSDPNLGAIGRVYLYSGQNGTLLFALSGEKAFDFFGNSVASASDVNLDGCPDLLVGANNWDDPNFTFAGRGRLYLYSGKDASLLQTQQGEVAGNQFGRSVSSASDVNLDGNPDYLAGAWSWNDPNITGTREGRMYLYSGKDHTLLSVYQPEKSSTQLGWSVSSASDLNLDGYPDLVAGANFWDDPNDITPSTSDNHGRIYVYSGKDCSFLFTYQGEQQGTNLGYSLDSASDVNLDGYPEILVGAPSWDDLAISASSSHGRAYVISGMGSLLFTKNGEKIGDRFGESVSAGEDADQDGYIDLLVGAHSWDLVTGTSDNNGRVYLYSGQDQTLLWTQNGENADDQFGYSISLLPDTNLDGTPDLVAGAYNWGQTAPFAGDGPGRVYLYSGAPLSLTSDEHLLSISVASTQNLSLDAGPSNAGRQYWVFGNFLVSGTVPGVTLGSVNIPLNPDPWTQVTIDFANTAALSMTKGALDGSGQASASLNSLAPQPAAPLGLTLQHCFLVYQAGPPDAYYMASNLVPWTTVP